MRVYQCSEISQNVLIALGKLIPQLGSDCKIPSKEYLEQIENSIEVVSAPNIPPSSTFPNHFLSDLQSALAKQEVVNFDYYSNYNDSITNRDVEPISLCFYSRHWHLVGFCRLRNALRDFRSDRIVRLTKTGTKYESRRHEYGSYMDLFRTGPELQEVVVWVSKVVARYISEQKYYMGFVESEPDDDGHLMKFLSGDLSSFAHWSLQFCDQIKVKSPQFLKDTVVDMVNRSYRHYQKR